MGRDLHSDYRMNVHVALAALTKLPDTAGLFIFGLVLISSGVVLRKVFNRGSSHNTSASKVPQAQPLRVEPQN